MSTIHLVYAHENSDLAEKLTQDIGRIGIPFQHYTDRAELPLGQLASRVLASDGPVVFLITDNFFKNRHCMAGALSMLQTLVQQKRVLNIVADGRQSSDGGQTFESVPTEFDRVVHAIQYMNYWQSAYLERNDGLSEVSDAEKEAYERELEAVRNIANEIGEMFSALREAKYFSWEELQKDSYALFFHHFQLQEWHEQYAKLAALDQEAPAPPPRAELSTNAPRTETPAVPGPLVPASTAEEERSEEAEQEIKQTTQDAWFWIEKGHTERGLELFRLALEQYPEHEFLQSEFQRALEQQERATNGQDKVETQKDESPPQEPEKTKPEAQNEAADKDQEAASYLQMGENALAKGDYLLAKYCWDRVTELQPELPGIYRKLALLTSEHLTDYKETAAHYLEQALAAEPEDADLHYRLAVLLRDHLDQPGKALQHFRDTVVLQPDHGLGWLALAKFTQEAGDHPQAESLYQHALEVAPSLKSEEYDALFLQPIEEAVETKDVPTPKKELETPDDQAEQAAVPQPTFVQVSEPLTVLITGATSGIGRATAELFARYGHRVILTGRRTERLEAIKEQFETDFQNEVHILSFDVRDSAAVKDQVEKLPEAWQNVDLLINNAGLAKGLSPIHEGELDHWETMIDTNLKGLLYVTRQIAPGMVQRRKGHIINVGSGAGKEVYPMGNVYCATKFAVDGLTRAMRLDLYKHNIRVSQVSPAHVEETEFARTRFDGDEEKAKIYEDFQPLKAADVAEVIYFIATRPPHVNIQDLWVLSTQQASSTHIDRSGRK